MYLVWRFFTKYVLVLSDTICSYIEVQDSEVNRYWYQNLRVGRDVEAALGFSK